MTRARRPIRSLLAPGRDPVIVATDLSRDMDRALEKVDVHKTLDTANASPFESDTRRTLVASLHQRLVQSGGDPPRP